MRKKWVPLLVLGVSRANYAKNVSTSRRLVGCVVNVLERETGLVHPIQRVANYVHHAMSTKTNHVLNDIVFVIVRVATSIVAKSKLWCLVIHHTNTTIAQSTFSRTEMVVLSAGAAVGITLGVIAVGVAVLYCTLWYCMLCWCEESRRMSKTACCF